MPDSDSPPSSHRAPDVGQTVARLVNALWPQRYSNHALLLTVAAGVIWFAQANVFGQMPTGVSFDSWAAAPLSTPTAVANLAAIAAPEAASESVDLIRLSDIHTFIPERSRTEITSYLAQKGDTVLGIAKKFGLTPETIVFSNPILNDNPHFLEPGQTLRIAPIDGLIRDVIAGDTIGGLARAYKVKPEDIINWPSNDIDPDNPQITVGQELFVPGGARGLLQISQPEPPSEGNGGSRPANNGGGAGPPSPKQPWVLRSGAGACPAGFTGGVAGSGAFIWPANHHFISGYDFSGIHPGIDVDGDVGEPMYAADSGVVVFAGWSDWGYGYTIVLEHGNNWWSLYGHLSGIHVGCGQGVTQGNQIGSIGNSGRSQGAHLHFEIYYGVYQTNPWNVLPPP